ncbi:hypothetical protein BN970_05899 [Mycolicibacterium conceptionense]|uniref:Uncharacterized protein n=1 Tax=Mycolicibacterium conceptionense TaxID=451644 RepID=A0A0U1DVN0_9MYCO|nr:hypothetical protein BN970_05899 [Mycolicibacterium conceptionense]
MNTIHLEPSPCRGLGKRRVIHAGLPNLAQSAPMISAVSSDAAQRAATISGWPGNATAVATSTTGLTAGAASMNVRAAAPTALPSVLSPKSLRATGTEPHSHPGKAAPPMPAARIAAPVRFGSHLASRSGVTNTAISPLMITPSARNGRACTKTPQNTVAAVAISGVPSTKPRSVLPAKASTMTPTTSNCMDVGRHRSAAEVVATADMMPAMVGTGLCGTQMTIIFIRWG